MNQQSFITHAQVVPPPVVPRQGGLGLLSVLAIVVAVLSGAVTGGLFLFQKSYDSKVDAAKGRLVKIQEKSQIASLERVKSLYERIEIARTMLQEHQYASQAFNFVEAHTLAEVSINTFSLADGVISMNLTVPNFTRFAQQLRHYRSTKNEVKSFTFKEPTLTDAGDVKFDVALTLTSEYLRTPPEIDAPVGDTADLTQPLLEESGL